MKINEEEALHVAFNHKDVSPDQCNGLRSIERMTLGRTKLARDEGIIKRIEALRNVLGMPLVLYHGGYFYAVEEEAKRLATEYRAEQKRYAQEKRDSNIREAQLRDMLLREAGAFD